MPQLDLAERLLLGPGPSNVSQAVREALARPMLGHLDPAFLAILDEVQGMLKVLFRTEAAFALPLSATGSGGMECCLVNLLEPGEKAVIAVQGVFGTRMRAIVERIGATAITVESPMGQIVEPTRLIEVIERERPRVVALVHAETSTGVAQPIPAIAAAARACDALVVLDCVTSLSGMDVRFDDWKIDAAYSGTQKCLAAPPGLSPVAMGPRALERIAKRRQPALSWYFDLQLIGQYFGSGRVYHHTAPVSMIFGLHAALCAVLDEGLEARFARHRDAHLRLVEGLESLGFHMAVAEEHRLPMLNAVIPPFADEATLRRRLMAEHGIEVGAGLGALAGKIWRIGLMGENARPEVVERLLTALETLL
jgi:alanine-glyoxylate transaminase / serine-glyoxylate transaminase / serine-pyruvate transaminase